MDKGTAHIHTLLNPVTRERTYTAVEAGKPLSAHLNVPDDVLMTCNGNEYNDEPLQDEDVLNLIVVPKGGEQGKAIGRSAIIIGSMLIAAGLSAPFIAASGGVITPGVSAFIGAAGTLGSIAAHPLHLNKTGLK